MERGLPIVAKKFWNVLRVAYFVVRKNITKPKLLADLNTMMKRGKIAGKAAIHNLMFHHHHHHQNPGEASELQITQEEYEFSCGDTPARSTFRVPTRLNKEKCSLFPPPRDASDEDLLEAVMEILGSEETAASPELPGFGPSPMVRQLRITDSPFPLRGMEEDEQVDEAAEKFIMKFYRDLERQNT